MAGEGVATSRAGTRAGHQYNLLGHIGSNASGVIVEPYLITLTQETATEFSMLAVRSPTMRSEWLCGPMMVQVSRATTPLSKKSVATEKSGAGVSTGKRSLT